MINDNFIEVYVLVGETVHLNSNNDPYILENLSAYPFFVGGTFSSLEDVQNQLVKEQEEYENMVIQERLYYKESKRNEVLENIKQNSYINISLVDEDIQDYKKLENWQRRGLTKVASFSYSAKGIKKNIGEQYRNYYIMKVIKPQ